MFIRPTLPPFLRFADEGAAGGAAATDAAATSAEAAQTAQTTDAAAGASANATASTVEKVEDLPDWAQKIIRDARKEAGDYRTAAKDAATKAQQEFGDKIAVALGLKPDAATDPAALAANLTKAQQDALNSARELAVFKAASAAGADPSKLLDRASFLTSIAGVDPTDGAAIKAAIDAAVTADQTLKATRAVGASTVETPGGPGEQGQITDAQLAQMTPEQIAEAYEKGLLKSLLT